MNENFGFVKVILTSNLKFVKLAPTSAFKDIFHDLQALIFNFQLSQSTFVLAI